MLMQNLITIEDSTIKAMMIDPRIMEYLPCLAGPKKTLASMKKGKPNCQRCEAEKRQLTSDAMRTAKACIRSARGQRLANLKKALGAKQIRVVARNGKGKPVKYTL